jgi:dienelactone hydrolase
VSRATLNQQKLLLLFNKKRGCKADWQMIYYADAVHGFTNPEYGDDKSTEYNAVAAKRSSNTKTFLNEVLKKITNQKTTHTLIT